VCACALAAHPVAVAVHACVLRLPPSDGDDVIDVGAGSRIVGAHAAV